MRSFGKRIKTMRVSYSLTSWLSAMSLLLGACFHEEAVPASVNFTYEVQNEDYSIPVEVTFENRTTGAENYLWTFEGGDPATSDKHNPGVVRYTAGGTYKVKLEAWNGDDRQSKEITLRILGTVTPDFETSIAINNISPVNVTVTNKTQGGTAYHWKFPDGEPASFDGYDPPSVMYTAPGDHILTLVIENGTEIDSISKSITVSPALVADFAIEPSFQDEDYEAPPTATLASTTVGVLDWQWQTTGGQLKNNDRQQSSIYFASPGTYTITMSVANGKETKNITHEITVKPNSGLRTHTDIKLGINTAHSTIGSLYSTVLRRVIRKDDPDSLGQYVDIAFFGLNASFTFNRFVSPDSVENFTFNTLPQAHITYFINSQEKCKCGLNFTETDFDQLVTGEPLENIDIESLGNGLKPFDSNTLPRIVLFRTDDNRKGAIKIKEYHTDGLQSYIVVDIKVQKP